MLFLINNNIKHLQQLIKIIVINLFILLFEGFKMKSIYFFIILFGISMISINKTYSIELKDNPFFQPYNTPFDIPPFDKIKTEHFAPAIKEAMKLHDEEIEKIANNPETPTFKNTIEALDYSGELFSEVATIFYNLLSANTNSELQALAVELSPLISNHSDNIVMNKKLFERIKKVYEERNKLNLNQEQKRLLEYTYKNFVRNGADLNDKKQKRLRKINEELGVLSLKFSQNILSENNRFKLIIDNPNDLSGLPKNIIDMAAETAKQNGLEGKWVFTLHNPSVMPFLQYADNRALREKIFKAYMNRGNNNDSLDNKQIIKEIINLRLERSKLLGYKSYAYYALEETMAKTPDNVDKLLMQLWKPALKVAKQEAKELQNIIDKEGGNFKLQPWDWRYYAEKLRKQKYDLDEEELKPYFQLENVKNGIFSLVNKLYGLKFVERNDVPKYHPDAICYEVFNEDGSHLGILYMDFHPRESKRGGAWMTNYREQKIKNGKFIYPIISIVGNFTKPTNDVPSLLTWDEVETFFHEFGHALHGLLSKCTYPSLSGTNVPRDFVELPSQIMENWVPEPQVLALFAYHYKTKEIIPQSLIDKIKNSQLFNQGFATVEYLAASLLDMAYHTRETKLNENIMDFEAKYLNKIGLIPEIISRYRTTYFNHIVGGYSAGYYSYIWSGVLDTDAYQAFKENGIFDKKTADSFRKNILEKGNTDDPMTLYKNFRGAEPSIEPLLKKRGLK